jgi:hypothetical protein
MSYNGSKYRSKEEAILAQREQQRAHTEKNREHIRQREHLYYVEHQKSKKDIIRHNNRVERIQKKTRP